MEPDKQARTEKLLKDYKFDMTRREGLWVRDYGDIVIYADFRQGLRFYGYMGTHPAPKGEVDERVRAIKRAIEAMKPGQARLC